MAAAVELVETAYMTGIYAGTSIGRNGQLTVSVSVSENVIEKGEVTEHFKTPAISELAILRIPTDIDA